MYGLCRVVGKQLGNTSWLHSFVLVTD